MKSKGSRDIPRSRSFRCSDKVWAHFKLICFLNEVNIQDQLDELICDYVEKNNSVYVTDEKLKDKDVKRTRDISTVSS